MFVECDQIALPTTVWQAALTDDRQALDTIRQTVRGLVTYMHNFSAHPESYLVVSARELERVGIYVTLTWGLDSDG